MIDWVHVVLVGLHCSQWSNYVPVSVYNERNSSISLSGLSYLAANALANQTDMTGFCAKCETTTVANCSICLKTLSIYYNVISNDTQSSLKNFDTYQWTNNELAARLIPVPDFNTCDDAQTLCIPGPCSVFDYNYLAQWYIDQDGKLPRSPTPLHNLLLKYEMGGSVQCVPIFGVQTTLAVWQPLAEKVDLHPQTVNRETMNVFPSRTTSLQQLYDPIAKVVNPYMNGGFVPVRQHSTTNKNPKSYYNGNYWYRPHSADTTENVVATTCSNAQLPPINIPMQLGSAFPKEQQVVDKQGGISSLWVQTLFYYHYNIDADLNFSDPTFFGETNEYNGSIAQHTDYGYNWDHREHCDISACLWVPRYQPPSWAESNLIGIFPNGYSDGFLNNLMVFLATKANLYNSGTATSIGRYNYSIFNAPIPGLDGYTLGAIYNDSARWKCVHRESYHGLPSSQGGVARLSSIQNPVHNKNKYTCTKAGRDGKQKYCNNEGYYTQCCYPPADKLITDPLTADPPTLVLGVQPYDMAVYINEQKPQANNSKDFIIRPQSWADGSTDAWHAAPTQVAPPFKNSKTVSQSAACDCGSITARYVVLEMPWDDLANFYTDQTWVLNNSEDGTETVLSEMSYGWDRPIGDVRTELPVGLYIPSTPKYGSNFAIHERNFLIPGPFSNATKEMLSNKTYLDAGAPLRGYLQSQLVFDANNVSKTEYTWNRHLFKYGACMRWPYGQVARMELSEPLQNKYYPPQSCPDGNCQIAEAALIGYCEDFSLNDKPRYAHCARDAYSQAGRKELCSSSRTTFVVVAKTLGIRMLTNVCDISNKVCLIIPGEPTFTIGHVLSNLDDASGFTFMVTPFNWSVANGLMAPDRGKYAVGATTNLTIETLDNSDKTLTGMAALTQEEFDIFIRPTTISNIQMQITNIVTKLSESYKNETGTYDLPFVYDMASITNTTLYPGMTDVGIYITAPYITIRSALPNSNLHFYMPDNQPGSCVRFFVTAPYFNLLSAVVDQEKCDPKQVPLEQTPVVFGGSDVTFATIDITVYNSNPDAIAVAFAGHYTSRFLLATTVNASFANIIVSDNSVVTYALAAARAVGTLQLTANTNATVVIQPIVENTFIINSTNLIDTIDISKYTSIYGSTIMRAEYPLMIPHESLHLILFGTLAAVNLLSALILAKRAYVRRQS